MTDLKIPKRFQLFGNWIEVKWVPFFKYQEGQFGEANYQDSEIILATESSTGKLISQKVNEQTFVHEMVHHCLEELGLQDELFPDRKKDLEQGRKFETFIDTFSKLLHQALTTMEYESDYPVLAPNRLTYGLTEYEKLVLEELQKKQTNDATETEAAQE